MKIEFVGKKLSCSLKRVVKRAFKMTLLELEQVKNLSICVNIVSPEEIQEINKHTRNIDKVTDVLSFPSFEVSPFEKVESKVQVSSKNIFLGDMALCMEEVCRQMEEYGESKKRVLARLVIHSCMHMLGFDHIKDEDFAEMEPIQNKILNKVIKK